MNWNAECTPSPIAKHHYLISLRLSSPNENKSPPPHAPKSSGKPSQEIGTYPNAKEELNLEWDAQQGCEGLKIRHRRAKHDLSSFLCWNMWKSSRGEYFCKALCIIHNYNLVVVGGGGALQVICSMFRLLVYSELLMRSWSTEVIYFCPACLILSHQV